MLLGIKKYKTSLKVKVWLNMQMNKQTILTLGIEVFKLCIEKNYSLRLPCFHS